MSEKSPEPNASAVLMGRIVFCLVGFVLFMFGAWGSRGADMSHGWLTAVLIFSGTVLVWAGLALPRRIVAHLGFNLPWLLPGD